MSNPHNFTQSEFSEYVKGLLAKHNVNFTNEEGETENFVAGEHEKLAETVFDVETGVITINNDKNMAIGNLWLINEYDQGRGESTTEIHNYSVAVEHLVPSFDDED